MAGGNIVIHRTDSSTGTSCATNAADIVSGDEGQSGEEGMSGEDGEGDEQADPLLIRK